MFSEQKTISTDRRFICGEQERISTDQMLICGEQKRISTDRAAIMRYILENAGPALPRQPVRPGRGARHEEDLVL